MYTQFCACCTCYVMSACMHLFTRIVGSWVRKVYVFVTIWYDMIWCDDIWYYMIYDTIWYDIFVNCSWVDTHMLLHTRQSSTQNNKYQVSHKHSCCSWWWTHIRPKHVEIDKYTKNKYIKNKLCTKMVLFTRLYRDARSTKQKNCS